MLRDFTFIHLLKSDQWSLLEREVEMKSLKSIRVQNGPLAHFPKMTMFERVSIIDFSNNILETVPDDFGTLGITQLQLQFNRLRDIPKSIWGNEHLVYLSVASNNIAELSEYDQANGRLVTLYLSNNSLRVVPSIALKQQSLKYLFLDGNELLHLPPEISELDQLREFSFNNSVRIKTIPETFSVLNNLLFLDARNNSIAHLPEKLKSLKSLQYAYFDGNPICTNGWMTTADKALVQRIDVPAGESCTKQCSPYCPNFLKEDPSNCYPECNSAQCEFQNNVCSP